MNVDSRPRLISRCVPVSAAAEEAHDLPRSLILSLGQERASDTHNQSLSEESQSYSYSDLQCALGLSTKIRISNICRI